MGIVMQEGDVFLSEVVLHQRLTTEQREAINRVRINLQLLLLSDLLTHEGHVVKSSLRQGIKDESYISTLCWPKSEPSRKDVGIWKRFISSLSRGDGSTHAHLRWTKPNLRHRKSVAFVLEDRKLVQVINRGEPRIFGQSRLSNKCILTDTVTNECFRERIEVDIQRNRYKVFRSMSTHHTEQLKKNLLTTNQLSLIT